MAPAADAVTRDPKLEALYDRVNDLARDDVRAGRDPQVLTGELADLQDEYDDAYVTALTTFPTTN